MKKLKLFMLSTFLLLSIFPNHLKAVATANPIPIDSTKTVEMASVKALELRLNEINAMDKSKLSRQEKKALRKEVRSINKEAKRVAGGVYISGGALLIILILLIILL